MQAQPEKENQALGIAFPRKAGSGRRSTSEASRVILTAAAGAVSEDAANAVQGTRNWRKEYVTHFHHLVELGLASPENALGIARTGLAETHRQFVFSTQQGDASLDEAMAQPDTPFGTLTINGRSPDGPAPWAVPVNGEQLSGERLRVQLERWVVRGVMEPSAADALHRCLDNPHWFDLSDRTFALLGAASEAGPLSWLTRWRARILAVDVPASAPWQRILQLVREGNGVLHAPVEADSELTEASIESGWQPGLGANLLTRTPDIAHWLASFGKPLDVGCLAYLHGEKHTRVSVAMDAIASRLQQADPATSIAYMATPTDSFAVPEQVAERVMSAWQNRSLLTRACQWPLGPHAFAPGVTRLYESDNGKRYGIVDSTIPQQGPNYALAKRLQQWRATVSRAEGRYAVMNIAPSTTTRSVVSNLSLAAGFAGADLFDVEVFAPETTNALMAALWVHELRYDKACSRPDTPLDHPYELFMDNAIHGGLWSVPYLPRTALPFAAAAGFVRRFLPGGKR
ncbi:hypothetical protein SAMN05216203_1341 [Marinobacter daqiaonensis]|uniref:Uncharacterized protein n=1 Tax=Marinobacter daqiaonensis TaxID=650891 RepID=A0A1I6HLU7_9GAMM|nr:hypothetical protein [Marinobacter daqiaonensis]SFR55441.1 hypothetical protein SAMN05216203_1341 [Marinobacter daqiaonensis]